MVKPFNSKEFLEGETPIIENNIKIQDVHAADEMYEQTEMPGTMPMTDPTSDPPIFSLNADCMNAIFDYMPLKDLSATAKTCTRLNEFVGNYFSREFKSQMIEFKDSKEKLDPKKLHLDHLLPFIQSLAIYGENIKVFREIENRKFENVKRIEFKNNKSSKKEITAGHGQTLKSILHCAELVEFKGNVFTDKHGKHILKHCLNMSSLCIETNVFKLNPKCHSDWMEKTYPKLRNFQLNQGFPDFIHCDRQNDELIAFFEKNQIAQLSIGFNIENSLKFIQENNIKLDKLTMRLSKDDIGRINDLLDDITNRELIRRFEIVLNDAQILALSQNLLSTLNGLESILMNFECMMDIPEFFERLKYLHIKKISWDAAPLLATKITNVEELYIEDCDINIIGIFAGLLPKLKRIAIRDAHGNPNDFNWLHLMGEREKLFGVRKLMIYINESVYIPIKKHENGIDQILITIKRSESLVPYRPFPKYS